MTRFIRSLPLPLRVVVTWLIAIGITLAAPFVTVFEWIAGSLKYGFRLTRDAIHAIDSVWRTTFYITLNARTVDRQARAPTRRGRCAAERVADSFSGEFDGPGDTTQDVHSDA